MASGARGVRWAGGRAAQRRGEAGLGRGRGAGGEVAGRRFEWFERGAWGGVEGRRGAAQGAERRVAREWRALGGRKGEGGSVSEHPHRSPFGLRGALPPSPPPPPAPPSPPSSPSPVPFRSALRRARRGGGGVGVWTCEGAGRGRGGGGVSDVAR